MTGDRNFSRCRLCGTLFENPVERESYCPKHRSEPHIVSKGGTDADRRYWKRRNQLKPKR